MAGRKPNATVCGVPVFLAGPLHYVGTTKKIGEGTNGHHREISKPGAKRLVEALGLRLPRVGHSIVLCGDQHLDNVTGTFYVSKNGPGQIAGASVRRRARGR